MHQNDSNKIISIVKTLLATLTHFVKIFDSNLRKLTLFSLKNFTVLVSTIGNSLRCDLPKNVK